MAVVLIVDEQLDVVEGYKEFIHHEPTEDEAEDIIRCMKVLTEVLTTWAVHMPITEVEEVMQEEILWADMRAVATLVMKT